MKYRMAVVLAITLAVVSAGPVSAQVIELKFSYWTPPVALPVVEGIIPWSENIEKATDGRVKFTLFPAESMARAPDHLDLVMRGTADIVWLDPNFTPGVFPLSDIIALPFLWPDSETCSAVMWQVFEKYLFGTEYSKFKVLFCFNVGLGDFFSNRRQVKRLDDFKGMKIASVSPIHSKTYRALGCSPAFMIEPEIYTALERGLIDGRFINWEGLWVFKNHEVTRFRTTNIRINTMPNIVLMNKARWNSLPEEIRKIIDAASGLVFSRQMGHTFDVIESTVFKKKVIEYDRKAGHPAVFHLPDHERRRLIETTEPVIEAWVQKQEKKGRPARAMLNDIREMVRTFH